MFTFSKNEIHTDKSSILEKEGGKVFAHRNVNIHSDSYLQENRNKLWGRTRRKTRTAGKTGAFSVRLRPPVVSRGLANSDQCEHKQASDFKTRNSLFNMK